LRKRILISICICSFLFSSVEAAGFIWRNEKVHPVQSAGPLGNGDLSSVVFLHQEDIQLLKQELARTRQELRDSQQELREFRSEFAQFKNLYFRRF
jgi:hypothetical protein